MKRYVALKIMILISAFLLVVKVPSLAKAETEDTPWIVEVESLFPMFFYGGYHLGVGLRNGPFRFRASVIDSGTYDVEPAGINNQSGRFQRFYDNGSFGFFGDYFLNDYWHVYTFVEDHRWLIKNKENNAIADFRTIDAGMGLGFQYFIYKNIYLQPAFHLYLRQRSSIIVGGDVYTIPGVDISPVIRIGIRI